MDNVWWIFILIGGVALIVSMARGIASYLMNSSGQITVRVDDKTILLEGITEKDTARIIKALSERVEREAEREENGTEK